MYNVDFQKQVINIEKLNRELRQNNSSYLYFNSKGGLLSITYDRNLTQQEIDSISHLLNNFVEIDVTEQIKQNLEKNIDVWIVDFLRRVRAENIEWGITQLNKTLDVQEIFEKQYDISGKKISMLGIMFTGSLTLLIPLIDYLIANPNEFDGLSPFITESRLLQWKNEVIELLS